MCRENHMSDHTHRCTNVCLGQHLPWHPTGLSFLPGGVGGREGTLEQMCKEPYQNQPCHELGVDGGNTESGG